MFAYIKGELVDKQMGYIIIDANGLGYKVWMSEMGIQNIGKLGEKVKVHTYYKVSEDDVKIFGFCTKEELKMFELIIQVSGIGAKTALLMLGAIEPSQFVIAVISNDINTLKKIPGIGPKSAQRIVLELKDKLEKEEQMLDLKNSDQKFEIKQIISNDNKVDEAILALQVLGYQKKDIEKVIEKIDVNNLSLEDIIKKCLKLMSI